MVTGLWNQLKLMTYSNQQFTLRLNMKAFPQKFLIQLFQKIALPLIFLFIFLFVSKGPLEKMSTEFASKYYNVKDESSYTSTNEYLKAKELYKLAKILPVWIVLATSFFITFFFLIRPQLISITNQFEDPHKLKAARKSDSWKLLYKEVQLIFNDWDPIGVVQDGVLDEYDTYAMQITGKLINGKSQKEIELFLQYVFIEVICINVPTDEIENYAKKFSSLISN